MNTAEFKIDRHESPNEWRLTVHGALGDTAVFPALPANPLDRIVVNISDVDPVEKPEEVYWVDPIHKQPD